MDIELLGFSGLSQMSNVHPIFVHFPIALAPVAWILHVTGLWKKDEGFIRAAQTVLWLATLGAAAAVLTGRRAAAIIPHDETIHQLLETHEHLGYAILTALLLAVVLGRLSPERGTLRRWGLPALLAIASLLVFQNADLGGRMVYVHGAGVKAVAARAQPAAVTEGAAAPVSAPHRHVHGQGASRHHD